MFRPLPLYIGLRYTRAKRANHFISFISASSIVGIFLGVAALITVLSVMNGFEQELRQRILGMTAHATVTGMEGELRDWQSLARELDASPSVVGTAPFVDGQGMLIVGGEVRGVLLRGILPERETQVSNLATNIILGELKDLKAGEFGIILGKDLALRLGAVTGESVTVVTPQTTVTLAGILPRYKRFRVVGVFEAGMYEYDSAFALMHIEDAAKLYRMEGAVQGLRVQMQDLFQAPRTIRQLLNGLPGFYRVSDWTQQHATFFRALQIEKTVMFIILLLIVAVAAFNIVSTLVMVVNEKRADIAILRTQGMTGTTIMAIFITQGVLIGLIGTVTGVIGGIFLASNVDVIVPAVERFLGIQFLSAEVYYINELKGEIEWQDVVTIAGSAFVLSVLATLYPAWRASRTNPAEALRYE
ncbi:MAG TPA: lipoprotein-releasing ABC transporter permease subunit [Gammaproteobacteria bacterium]|nr:lipoprotein-releasing ABC transporter permease subunit [Gammaproteobacteria bacterium]